MTDSREMTKPDWTEVERALVIMAHPDDPDFSCAGSAIQMARQGIEVTYMILTNGDKGNHNPLVTRGQLILMRKEEQRKAAALCGVKDVLFMDEEDGFLRLTRRYASGSVARSGAFDRSWSSPTAPIATFPVEATSTIPIIATPVSSPWRRSSPPPTIRCSIQT